MARKKGPSISPDFSKKPNNNEFAVTLNVSGGVEDEKYQFNFDLDREGQLSCDLECKMSDRNSHFKKKELKKTEIDQLSEQLQATSVLESLRFNGPFIPCTLVGTLQIQIGDRKILTRFVADPEQAKMHRFEQKEVEKAVNIIYDMAAKKLRIKSARPSMN